MGFFLKKIRLLFVNSIMKIYIGAEVEFVEFCDLHAWERERKRANIYFYRLLFQIIHSFKHFIIIVLNRRYVGKCKYFYSNFFFFGFAPSNMRQCDRIRSLFYILFFLLCFTMFCKSRTWRYLALSAKCFIIYFIFMVSNVSDVAIYLHLIFFQ